MNHIRYTAKWGLRDGLSIAFAYFPVAFAFGLFAVGEGLQPWQAVLISMLNVTSAGQLAGVPIFVGSMSYFEMALTQFTINMRYALTSITLSQKLDTDVRTIDRFAIGYMNTDEVFALCAEKEGVLGRPYLYGIIAPPFFGWTLGTFVGAYAGTLLPVFVITILGFAIYGMFFSILLPPAKKSRAVLSSEILAATISCILYYVPWFSSLSSGFRIIITALFSSVVIALIFPISSEVNKGGQSNE